MFSVGIVNKIILEECFRSVSLIKYFLKDDFIVKGVSITNFSIFPSFFLNKPSQDHVVVFIAVTVPHNTCRQADRHMALQIKKPGLHIVNRTF